MELKISLKLKDGSHKYCLPRGTPLFPGQGVAIMLRYTALRVHVTRGTDHIDDGKALLVSKPALFLTWKGLGGVYIYERETWSTMSGLT